MDSRDFCFPPEHRSRQLLEQAWFADQGYAFQRAMYDCGSALAEELFHELGGVHARVCVMAPAEDADGIAKGVSDYLVSKGIEVRLMCLWSRVEKVYEGGMNVAPVLRTFAEPGFAESEVLVAVQSFLGDGTVLKTNVTAALQLFVPDSIQVLAPAMHAGLRAEMLPQFPKEIGQRFNFHTFVYDHELDRKTGELKPGIGGLAHDRFGLSEDKPYLDFPLSVLEILQRDV